MLRQLILICALGGLPLMSTAAGTAATSDIPAATAAKSNIAAKVVTAQSTQAANDDSKAFECTLAPTNPTTQGPVWVVQAPGSAQGPVWVVLQDVATKRDSET